LDDEAEPVIAQGEASVLQHPGIAAFDRPAVLAQCRPARLTPLVNARLGPKGATQLAMMLRVVAFIGEYRANAGHDREGSQEQPLEDKRVINIGRRREAGDRHAVAIGGNMVFGASLGPIGRIGTGQIATALGPHRAGIEDQVWMAALKLPRFCGRFRGWRIAALFASPVRSKWASDTPGLNGAG